MANHGDEITDIFSHYITPDPEDMDQDDLASKVPKTGSRKPFKNLSFKQQLWRTNSLQQAIENWMESENNNFDGDLTVSEILGFLLHRNNINVNKGISEVGMAIFNGVDQQNKKTVPMESALALKHWIGLTKEDMRRMKFFMNSYQITFPSTTNLLK